MNEDWSTNTTFVQITKLVISPWADGEVLGRQMSRIVTKKSRSITNQQEQRDNNSSRELSVFFLQNFSRWLLSAFREYFSFSLILWHKTYHVGRKLNCKLFDPMRSRLPCASKMEGAFSFFISKRDILCFSHLWVRSKALTIRYFFRYYSSGEVHVRRNMSQIFQWLPY